MSDLEKPDEDKQPPRVYYEPYEVSTREANKELKRYRINPDVVRPIIWKFGLNRELNNILKMNLGNVLQTKNMELALSTAACVAMNNLIDYPDYYKRLRSMLKKADKFWAEEEKPKIRD